MTETTFTAGGKTVTVYLPEQPKSLPLLYTFLDAGESAELAALIGNSAVLAAVSEPCWEAAFTPWPAPRAFKKAPDFGGGADACLDLLAATVLPETEQQLGLEPAWRGVLGYSLAGLLAVYSAYRKPLFSRIAAVSASLWFDGWQQFVYDNTPQMLPDYAYFSVGDTEKNAKNPRLAQIETAISATQQNWQALGAATFFETNRGGHFENAPQRLAKAAERLLAAP